MHEGQRLRVARGIGRTIGQRAFHVFVYRVDPFDHRIRVVPLGERRHRDELRRALQPAMHVLAEIGMIEHTLQRVRVQHLQQQRPYAPDHHRNRIGMDQADRGILREIGVVRRGLWRLAAVAFVEHRAHAIDHGGAQAFGRQVRRWQVGWAGRGHLSFYGVYHTRLQP